MEVEKTNMATAKSSKPFLIDAKAVRILADILKETDLTEIEYELEEGRIRVARTLGASSLSIAPHQSVPVAPTSSQVQVQTAHPAESTQNTQDWATHLGAIKSPLVGTAYLCPQPGAAPFIKEGDTVSEGQTLMILEAMKVMNPIKAPKAGQILKILIENAQPIEYGEVLVVIG